jgi:hypothetical protein
MAAGSIKRRLILLAGAAWIAACAPKAVGEPPPRVAGSVPTDADAGLPPMPLTKRGVVVPSDVKLETAHGPATSPPNAPLTGAPTSPGEN